MIYQFEISVLPLTKSKNTQKQTLEHVTNKGTALVLTTNDASQQSAEVLNYRN